MKKQNIVIVLLMLFILVALVGYEVFKINSETIEKTSSVKSLNVDFIKIGKIEEVGSEGAYAKITSNKKNVTINVPSLLYKGAYAKFPITVKNTGNLTARLRSIIEKNISSNGSIQISYDGLSVFNKPLKPGDTTEFYVTVSWKDNEFAKSDNLSFQILLNYVQV